MKNILRILLIFFIAVTTAPIANSEEKPGIFTLRFIDQDTLTPIISKSFLLVPRRMLLKAALGAEDPNLEFSKKVVTDNKGYLVLSKNLIDELSANGKFHIDCRSDSDDYARFGLNTYKRDWGITYTITIFYPEPNGKVAGTWYLYENQTTVILLGKNKDS